MIDQIIKNYNRYRTEQFNKLKFNYNDFIEALSNLNGNFIKKENIGKSFEERDLFLLTLGNGKIKIILWSQMHGNEPISTQGLFDLLTFFSKSDEFNNLRKKILTECSLYFFPLVNPDGAEKFLRRNSQGIDLNRDAQKLTTPEAKVLNSVIDQIKPDFAFNLHDQERYYGTKKCEYPTALSFLSPSCNPQKTIDDKREKAMKLIVSINKMLQKYLPNRIAKYNDSFMPNAFGDNVQAKSISTLLFEAGYIIGDEQRQEVRKFYFVALLEALNNIANNSFLSNKIIEYQEIPYNIKQKFSDILLKNLTISQNGKDFATDILIKKNNNNSEQFSDLISDFLIYDIGDLQNKSYFKTIDCQGFKYKKSVVRLQNATEIMRFCNNQEM